MLPAHQFGMTEEEKDVGMPGNRRIMTSHQCDVKERVVLVNVFLGEEDKY